MLILTYLAVGACAGLLAGLFGIGGGIIIVPALVMTFAAFNLSPDVAMHMAVGTSLATIIVTSSFAVRAHHAKGAVDWTLVRQLGLGMALGAILGGYAADSLSGAHLQLLIAIYALLVAISLLSRWRPKFSLSLPNRQGQTLIGSLIGSISALFGIGGGTLTVPVLLACGVPMKRAVGVSSATGIPIALFGTLSFIYFGLDAPQRPEHSLGYVYLPAFVGIIATSAIFAKLGARLAHLLPPALAKRLFALVLLAVAAKLLWPLLSN